jgi:hypothetical protein
MLLKFATPAYNSDPALQHRSGASVADKIAASDFGRRVRPQGVSPNENAELRRGARVVEWA